jgi:hypothetical protein
MRHRRAFAFAGLFCASIVTGTPMAASYDIAAEIGRPLSSLDATAATEVLTWYSEGKVLTYAPKPARIELLKAIMAASPEGGKTYKRAELLLRSAETSGWPDQ